MSYRRDYQSKQFEVLRTAPTETKLPTDRPIANYYRQSTQRQVGNISTSIQTIDIPLYLERLGWRSEDILMIDMDQGVSGTTKIDEREGMKLLFGLISTREIGAVACQDEDRLFRDVTQIQVNIFIEACKSSRVLIITPSMIYDFAHPTHGSHHARQFRFKCEMAADYIETVIRGKLNTAKRNMQLAGRWAGSSVPTGYMVDMHKTLPDGRINEHWRRFVIFEPYAVVVREYYRIFIANGGNLTKTLRDIRTLGPYYPEACNPPDGFKILYRIRQDRNGWCPTTVTGLVRVLSNATYLGHAMFQNTIVCWNNHPPIIDEETFFKAFNYISPVGLNGQPNPDYRSTQAQRRPSLEESRPADYPLLSGLIVAKWEGHWKQVGTHWRGGRSRYNYAFYCYDGATHPLWRKSAAWVDKIVITMMLGKLRQTFNGNHWDQAVEHLEDGVEEERRLKEAQLRQLETVMENLIVSLASLNTPPMIAAVEKRYQHAQAEKERLEANLAQLAAKENHRERLNTLKNSFAKILEEWDDMSANDQREVVHLLIDHLEAQKLGKDQIACLIYWTDGSKDETTISRLAPRGTQWLPQEVEQLIKLIESDASKLEIAQAFPDRKWGSLLYKYRETTGKRLQGRRDNVLTQEECYNDYLARVEKEGKLRDSSSTWLVRRSLRNGLSGGAGW